MRKLLNTLYVTSENSYLGLDGENVVVYDDKKEIGRVPLHNLEGIVSFGYRGTSPALMGACADKNISLCYLTPQGKFLARITGKIKGNVILREQQFLSCKDETIRLRIAKNCILGKVYNARWVLERAVRDHSMQIDAETVKTASLQLKSFLDYIQNAKSIDQLRGYEGEAASIYFGVFDELILQQKKDFIFQGRNKRPPLDNVNAMLSFVYTLLTNQITSALETVGLDPYVGYMHTDRPGRASLSLDLIEELRAVMADRFVLSLINKKIVNGKDFTRKENGAVFSHMTVMYANALYQRGFVKEGYRALYTLLEQAMNTPVSLMYPGIPEYFDADGKGKYPYLTGAASWYMMTMVTQIFGFRGEWGDLVLEPKILLRQFDESGNYSAQFPFRGQTYAVVYQNPQKKEYGDYRITEVWLDGQRYAGETNTGICIPFAVLEGKENHTLRIVLG